MKNKLNTLRWNAKALLSGHTESTPGSSIILIYHGLVQKDHLRFNSRFITINDFREQIRLLQKDFNMCTVQDLFAGNIEKSKLNVAITFDDGYKNNYSYAADILNTFNVPATFFITAIRSAGYQYLWTDFLDITTRYSGNEITIDGKRFKKHKGEFVFEGRSLKYLCKQSDWQFKVEMMQALGQYEETLSLPKNRDFCELMDSEQIREMAVHKLFTIGSHALYHNNLDRISMEDAGAEMSASKKYLEACTGKATDMFAFPDGAYNHELVDLAENAGYNYQLLVNAIDKKSKKDKRLYQRFGIHPYLTPGNQLKYIKKGTYL